VCLNRDWFSSLEKLDGCFAVMSNDHPCNIEGMGTVRIKMDDRIVRELKEVRYVPQLKRNLISVGALKMRIEGSEVCTSTQKKSYLCWCFGNVRSCGIYMRWCSQDDQRLNDSYEGRLSEQFLPLEG